MAATHPYSVDLSDSSDGSDEEATGSSTSSSHNHSVKSTSSIIDKAFIQREEQHVRGARYFLALTTLACAIAVSVAVYYSIRQNDYQNFQKEYEIYANDLLVNIAEGLENNLHLLEEVGLFITSTAITSRSTFPNVTLPHFNTFTGHSHANAGGFLVTLYAPLVTEQQRVPWEQYTAETPWWVNITEHIEEHDHEDERSLEEESGHDHEESHESHHTEDEDISYFVYERANETKVQVSVNETGLYAPLWHMSPLAPSVVNENLLAYPEIFKLFTEMRTTGHTAMSGSIEIDHLFEFAHDEGHEEDHNGEHHPHNVVLEPVYDTFDEDQTIVGVLVSLLQYDSLFTFYLPSNTKGLHIVFTESCGGTFTYQMSGQNLTFIGYEDHHDPAYSSYQRTQLLKIHEHAHEDICKREVHVYPSSAFQDSYSTNKPVVYTCIVAFSFLLMGILILLYDCMVTRRQEKTLKAALRSGKLIASLFPANVRERLMNDTPSAEQGKFQDQSNGFKTIERTRPIADYFANTTIMFADISGFTAWCSTREPCQVFELLETIYSAFDQIAKSRRIFKVETVGDCYVAICGIPTYRPDHAVAMAKFARSCLSKMNALTKSLEVKLGPDTAALSFRVGLHSGPVTGGVLRGDNARFQLFGDTVNTAARMESTGIPNQIQMSQATADLLIEASKAHWLKPRDELVSAKGKGSMKTYWLTNTDNSKAGSQTDSSQNQSVSDETVDSIQEAVPVGINEKTLRLVDWNVELLLRYLKLIVSRRNKVGAAEHFEDWNSLTFSNFVIQEVAEIIVLPKFSAISAVDNEADISIEHEVEQQLHAFVSSIAKMYRDNHFHNFDHASHVTMSVVKLMGRIVPSTTSFADGETNDAQALHDHTYGITSDPLTQFACIFAALIHDIDHEGVPNTQLVKEKSSIALEYSGKSVAEQHSLALAWNLLMKPEFFALRQTLCATLDEAKRFRQLVVNAVMATDIMAPDLKELRQRRWTEAFCPSNTLTNESDTINRKATIVIEHLIQASDVCHTMQHWHVYRKWNERLFMEMSKAYADGRAENNPAETWYKGEIGFFDFYIIPLAKKLAECKVFGVSSDEFLSYAMKNRAEWEARGEDVVREMIERLPMENEVTA